MAFVEVWQMTTVVDGSSGDQIGSLMHLPRNSDLARTFC